MSEQRGQTAERQPGESSRGQGGYGWSPPTSASPYDRDDDRWWLEREVESLTRALRERGVLDRHALRETARGRFWGPGRFGRALQEAERLRKVIHRGGDRYGPA